MLNRRTVVSKRTSLLSRTTPAKSSISSILVKKLQKQLEEEKIARQTLEREIAEIKRINSELSTTLGLMAK